MSDFETTVYEGQEYTEAWACAIVELGKENVEIFHSIKELYNFLISLDCPVTVYYHNLKFDGHFWLSYLLNEEGYKQAYETITEKETGNETVFWWNNQWMKNNYVKYTISDMGMWYTITFKAKGHFIELRDSLKLLPFSVKRIGDSFKTAHKKLNMEYKGFRYAGCNITDEEKEYIKNDVLVVKEALEIMQEEGHDKLTIGSCCLEEYKRIIGKLKYETWFPNVSEFKIDKNWHKYETADAWIRRSYKGGWCYLVKGKENQIKLNGTTADVNSLYPSMMHSESGNKFPVGYPNFWVGNFIPDEALAEDKYYFVRIKTRFDLKPGYLPFVQIKGSAYYRSNECLETSVIPEERRKKGRNREVNYEERVELTLTMTDYELLKEHYYLTDFEILDGCYFDAETGIFDEYIDKYKKIKMESKGALRELAKLFLNNLYGKMASSTNSSFKVAFVREDKSLGFFVCTENKKKPGYIPVGSAITSYARNFTIRAAQKNYHGVENPGFIYADTDSIHCDLSPDEITGIKVDDKNFCCWKLESCWDYALFVRQKTYIEHITHENRIPVEELKDENGNPKEPYYNVKAAGMPERCKDLFLKSMEGYVITEEDKENYSEEEIEFLSHKRTLEDFKIGLCVPGKLLPQSIRGGVVLMETTFEMR